MRNSLQVCYLTVKTVLTLGRKEQCGLEGPEPRSALSGVPQQYMDVAGLCHGCEKRQPESTCSTGTQSTGCFIEQCLDFK